MTVAELQRFRLDICAKCSNNRLAHSKLCAVCDYDERKALEAARARAARELPQR